MDPKKAPHRKSDCNDEPEEALREPWDHPDQDPNQHPDLDQLKKSTE